MYKNFRPVPFMVFEILGFKVNNENNNDKKNGVVEMAVCF